MKNFIYRISVDLNDNATVRQQVCVVAEDLGKANLRMRIAAFNWWGYPDREEEGSWVVECEHYEAFVPCEPEYIGVATDAEVETLRKFEYYFDVLTPCPTESIISDIKEVIEVSDNLDELRSGVIKYFGAEIYARLALEKEDT